MNSEQQLSLEELKRIRTLMERSTVYNSLSGLSGAAAGLVGILAYTVTYGLMDPLLEKNPELKSTPEGQAQLIRFFFSASIISLALAFAFIFYFNWRKAKQDKLPFLESSMQKMFINLFIPLAAGGIYCIMLVREAQWQLIAPSMLVFYGLAMLQASRYTIAEIGYLGFAELVLGLISIFLQEYGMWFWLLGFGFVNLIYGVYIYLRYERKKVL